MTAPPPFDPAGSFGSQSPSENAIGTTKILPVRMGRTPAEIAEGTEDYWEGGLQIHRSCFLQPLWSAETVYLKNPPQKR